MKVRAGQEVEESAETAEEPVNDRTSDELQDCGCLLTRCGEHMIEVMTIIGQIEGHDVLSPSHKTTKYEHLIPRLVEVEQEPLADGLLVLLNTVGGDVEAGLAIAEVMAGMKKPVVSLVLGGGHSIGVPIAVAAKYSLIAPSATMTIHPVRMSGLMLGVPQAFEYFQRMQQRITRFVTAHSGISAERYNALAMNTDELVMDIGTVLDGEDAVREGLIDRLGTLGDALDALNGMIEEKNSAGEDNS